MRKVVFILWLCVCVFFTFDTGAFLFPSLSQTLLGEYFVLLLGVVVLLYCMRFRNVERSLSVTEIGVVVGMLYLFMHALFIADAEWYKLHYLLVSLLLIPILARALRAKLLDFCQIETGLLAMAVIHLCYLLLQAIKAIPSGCSLYSLTGAGENPNVSAIFLAVSVPLLIRRLRRSSYSWGYGLMLALCVVFVIVLKCRTAYVGLCVFYAVRMCCSTCIRKRIGGFSLRKRFLYGGIMVAILVSSSLVFYNMKRESADGRILVWKLSAKMIVNQPAGHGTGMFEPCYNLYQGEYFHRGHATKGEKKRASIIYMAYNDFLEVGVESGVVGLALFICFYVVLIRKAYWLKDKESLCLLSAFLAMSMVNFVYSTIQPWMFLMAYASYLLSKDKPCVRLPSFTSHAVSIAFIAVCITLMVRITCHANAQAVLKAETDRLTSGQTVNLESLESEKKYVGTSCEYYMFLARVYMKQEDYEKALGYLTEASRYVVEPQVYLDIFKCMDCMGKTAQGIAYIERLCWMLPQNLTSRMILMRWYHSQGMTKESLAIAREIVEMPVKIQNETSRSIQREASLYISHYK